MKTISLLLLFTFTILSSAHAQFRYRTGANITEIKGLLLDALDEGYPNSCLLVALSKDTLKIYFDQSQEGLLLKDAFEMRGKCVRVRFVEQYNKEVLDILQAGKSLLGVFAADKSELRQAAHIRGILHAEMLTPDGLDKSELAIENEQGELTIYEFFVNPNIVAAHGQPVTLFYTNVPNHHLVTIHVE